MGFDIPEPFCWDESFKVFYQNLDEQHRGLFKGIFDCAANPDCLATLQALKDLVKQHFDTEEDMMGKSNYGELASHKEIHDKFVEKLGTLSAPLSNDTIHFAKDWLVNHIKGTDFKYKEKLG